MELLPYIYVETPDINQTYSLPISFDTTSSIYVDIRSKLDGKPTGNYNIGVKISDEKGNETSVTNLSLSIVE